MCFVVSLAVSFFVDFVFFVWRWKNHAKDVEDGNIETISSTIFKRMTEELECYRFPFYFSTTCLLCKRWKKVENWGEKEEKVEVFHFLKDISFNREKCLWEKEKFYFFNRRKNRSYYFFHLLFHRCWKCCGKRLFWCGNLLFSRDFLF